MHSSIPPRGEFIKLLGRKSSGERRSKTCHGKMVACPLMGYEGKRNGNSPLVDGEEKQVGKGEVMGKAEGMGKEKGS